MSMKHPARYHARAAKNRRLKAAQLKQERRERRDLLAGEPVDAPIAAKEQPSP